jgi:hypothetical protein
MRYFKFFKCNLTFHSVTVLGDMVTFYMRFLALSSPAFIDPF